jgi:hypothetical protein
VGQGQKRRFHLLCSEGLDGKRESREKDMDGQGEEEVWGSICLPTAPNQSTNQPNSSSLSLFSFFISISRPLIFVLVFSIQLQNQACVVICVTNIISFLAIFKCFTI